MINLQALEQELMDVLNRETKESLLEWYAEQDRNNAQFLADDGVCEAAVQSFVPSQEITIAQAMTRCIVVSNLTYSNNIGQGTLYPIAA
ncbi:MAG: hypothetical protein JNN25_06755 [Candidatus Kapabacteria bacterium]|nr:hypothetical protein [Candidatus Kapabacteria bacterium]